MEKSLASESNLFFPISISLLFFLNSAFFGGSISLILLLSPLWIYLSQDTKAGVNKATFISAVVIFCYLPFHIAFGVASYYHYFRSLIIVVSLLLFINVGIYYIKKESHQLDFIFRSLLIINAVLAVISLLLLFIPSLKDTVWYVMAISEDIAPMPRLKLFTPEASHYSFIIAPLFIYFLIRWMFCEVQKPFLMLLMATFPLLLSFSLGVMAALVISFLLLFAIKYNKWFYAIFPPLKLLLLIVAVVLFLALLYYFFPENPLYVRLQNLMEGKDTSGRGRTYESFILADKIAALKSKWWGIGPGQLKLIGRDTIVQYYHYMNVPEVIRIPNASAETIAWFGYTGFALRLLVQVVLFIKTKVWLNAFRLWLFLFVFIYQFTGSYITNGYEYMLWILIFSPIFKDLNFHKKICR